MSRQLNTQAATILQRLMFVNDERNRIKPRIIKNLLTISFFSTILGMVKPQNGNKNIIQ
jgi:hypothetical protein